MSLFFKREKNLLQFLRHAVSRDEYRTCKCEILQFIHRVIVAANQQILPYTTDIKDMCLLLFNSDKYSDVRCLTFPILTKIFEITNDNFEISAQLNIKKIVDDFFLSLMNSTKLSSSGNFYSL